MFWKGFSVAGSGAYNELATFAPTPRIDCGGSAVGATKLGKRDESAWDRPLPHCAPKSVGPATLGLATYG
jgi:hypothetical protein